MMMGVAGSQSSVGVTGQVLHQVSRTAELDRTHWTHKRVESLSVRRKQERWREREGEREINKVFENPTARK